MEPLLEVSQSGSIWRELSLSIGSLYASLKTLVKGCPDNYLSFKVPIKRGPS
jgi:hypothetical protein